MKTPGTGKALVFIKIPPIPPLVKGGFSRPEQLPHFPPLQRGIEGDSDEPAPCLCAVQRTYCASQAGWFPKLSRCRLHYPEEEPL